MDINGHEKRTFLIILLSLLVLLIGFYLLLPYFLTRYINRELQNLEEYEGRIEGVEMELFRGGFTIKGIEIKKIEGEVPVPFFQAPSIETNIEWRALFKGKVVSEIYVNEPEVNFVAGPTEEQSQFGEEEAWNEVLQDVMPFQINRFEVRNGTLRYRDFHADPQVNVPVRQLNLVALNLTNVEQVADSLPSTLEMSAVTVGQGQVGLSGRLNLLKELPDFNLNFKLVDMQLTSVNDFTEAYAKFTFEEGLFSLFSEMTMHEGHIGGYVRPIMDGVRIFDLQEEQSLLRKAWEGILDVTQRLFRNRPKERFATQVPVSGHIDNVEVGVWTTVLNIFRNAFIESFAKAFDGEGPTGLGENEDDNDKKSDWQQRREERREERRERREQRQQEREERKQEKEAAKKD
ncbi:DUF748 domain-containing protein [soil metagenome]